MFYIYHIPDFVQHDGSIGKIGVSENLKSRLVAQKIKDYEILETHTCEFKVSEREIELQKEYGYLVDTIPYWKTRKMAKTGKGGKSANGKGGRNNSVENKRKAGMHKRTITFEQAEWARKQYARGVDMFGKKITYKRLSKALGYKSRQAVFHIIKKGCVSQPLS